MESKNKKYLDMFMRWHDLEGSSKAHKTKSRVLLTIFLRDYVGDRENNKPENLILIHHKDHIELHKKKTLKIERVKRIENKK